MGDRTRERSPATGTERVAGILRQDGLLSHWSIGDGRDQALRDGAHCGPAQPPSPAAARASYQVTKLPQDSGASDWRGRSQSASSAAVLGQEAWRHAHLPTPRKPLTQARWRAPPLSRGHAVFLSTHTETIQTQTHTHTCTHAHSHTHDHVYAFVHIYTFTRAHTDNTDMHIHTYTSMHTQAHAIHINAQVHTHIHLYTCTYTTHTCSYTQTYPIHAYIHNHTHYRHAQSPKHRHARPGILSTKQHSEVREQCTVHTHLFTETQWPVTSNSDTTISPHPHYHNHTQE